MPEIFVPGKDEWNALVADIAHLADATYDHTVRLAALEAATPPPPPDPTAPKKLIGGWRLSNKFCRGGLAIDFSTNMAYVVGQRNEVARFELPPMGIGEDINAWPSVSPAEVIPGWWARGYANDLEFRDGQLWVAPRIFYATGANVHPDLILYGSNGETVTIDLPGGGDQQRYSGFCKGRPDLLTGGGYEAGQGTVSGTTVAGRDGTIKLTWGWPSDPADWNGRAPREPNYRPVSRVGNPVYEPPARNDTIPSDAQQKWDAWLLAHGDDYPDLAQRGMPPTTDRWFRFDDGEWYVVPRDGWIGWLPREVNGVLEGRWASDRIIGGSHLDPATGDLVFYPWMATGDVDYNDQSAVFEETPNTYEYRIDGKTYQIKSYKIREDLGQIGGRELGPDGKVYLCELNAWQGPGLWKADPVLKVFG